MSDELEFAVVFKFDRGRAAIFEGSEEAVYFWLTKVDQHSIWEIWNRTEGSYEPAWQFLSRLKEKYKPKPQLTEEDVRRIFKEELSTFMNTVKDEACVPDYYETGTVEKALLSIIEHLAGCEADQAVTRHEDSTGHNS